MFYRYSEAGSRGISDVLGKKTTAGVTGPLVGLDKVWEVVCYTSVTIVLQVLINAALEVRTG